MQAFALRRGLVGFAALAAAAAFLAAGSTGRAASTTQSFAVVADTYSSAENPTSTHGSLTYMKIEGAATTLRNSYVKFVVSGTSGTVARATLRVFTLLSSTTGFDVHFVPDNTWSESTLTAANAPTPSPTVTASSGAFAANVWLSLDVTSLVSGDGTYSFALTTSGSQIQLATKERGASTAAQLDVTWDTVATPPANTAPPVVSGTAEQGKTLTATTGTWSGTAPLAYAYQWQRCGATCADIAGATSSAYTLTVGDVGFTMRAAVTASNSAGSATAASDPTAVVAAATPPANTTLPAISGTPVQGATLSATAGTWSGSTPMSFAYQWRRCSATCADIAGATATSYTLVAADVGSTIRVDVTAANVGGTATAESDPTAVITGPTPPANTSLPTISGTPQQGATLSAATGTWSGSTPMSFAYQWRRCTTTCVDIAFATAAAYTLQTADVGSTIRVDVTASNVAGAATAESAATAVVTAPASVTIAAAGDIACDPASSSFNGGLGTSTTCRQKYTSDLLLDPAIAAVLPLGDLQYECGGGSAFTKSYDPSWGRVKAITRPAPGNKEYATSGGSGCDKTGKALGYYGYFGAAAGDPTKGYYSFDLGAWHIISLNSNCDEVGGCSVGSPQETWLKADLAASTAACTLAYWHHPRFSSSLGTTTDVAPFWDDLYAANADVVLNGHAHVYERFAPQNPSGKADSARGIRQFTVGVGGKSFHSFSTPLATSEVRQNKTYGVLKLTLRATGYDWQFVPEAGKTFTDSGSTACH